MSESEERLAQDTDFDPDVDRYPDLHKATRFVLANAEMPEGQVERLEVHLHASGHVTWRVWPAKSGEALGGVAASSDLT